MLQLKADQLIPMLMTLAIDDLIELRELDRREAQFKRAVRHVSGAARNLKFGLQQKMPAGEATKKLPSETKRQARRSAQADIDT